MKSHAHKTRGKKRRPVAGNAPKEPQNKEAAAQLKDNRPESMMQRKLRETMENSPRTAQLKAVQELADRRAMKTAQRMKTEDGEEKPAQGKSDAVQKKPGLQSASQGKNNTGLPDNLKAGVEHLSGMDMSDVKVHYNSDKPSQLQAHAYAQGADIHLAPGQEKHLLHETWHVAQQKQGRVKPTKQLKSGVNINDDAGLEKEADIKGQAALQALSGSQSVMQAKTASGTSVIQREPLSDLDFDGLKAQRDTKDRKIWFKADDFSALEKETKAFYLNYGGRENRRYEEQWIALGLTPVLFGELEEDSSKVALDDVVGKVTAPFGDLIGYEGISGVSDKMLGRTIKTSTAGKEEHSKEELKIFGKGTGKSRKEVATGLGVGADTITGLTGITGFVKGIKDLSDPDKKTSERFVAFLESAQGAGSIGESVSKLKTTGTGGGKLSAKLGSGFESFASGFGAIKEGFLSMKKIFDAVMDQDLSASEKKKEAREAVFHALESAKGVVLSLKAYRELTTGSASGKLMSIVPGLGIAIAAMKLIMQAYYTIQSHVHYIIMDAQQEDIVRGTKVPGKTDKEEKRKAIDDASEFYRKRDALISNKRALLDEDTAVVNQIDKKEKTATLSADDKKRRKKRIERIKHLYMEIAELQKQKFEKEDLSKEDVEEYTLVKELKSGNLKRIKRQGIHIATEMARITADVMILTGVGGLAGGITKGVAGGVDLALPTVRLAKQTGRDRAGREEAKRSIDNPIKYHTSFDTSKTSSAKKDFRLDQVSTLMKFAVYISHKEYKSGGDAQKDLNTLKMYLTATGVDLETLYAHNGKPDKQITLLFEALSAREL